MSDNQSNDIVDMWARLMDEWAAASVELDALLDKANSLEPDARTGWQKSVDDAQHRRDLIKQRIEKLIGEAMAGRSAERQDLILGQLPGSLPMAADGFTSQMPKRRIDG
nr:hypothetical protein REQ54_00013 [Rhizobium sp. Q54]